MARKRQTKAVAKKRSKSRRIHGALSAAGAAGGEYMNPLFGGAVGGYLGNKAADLFERITGYGDYQVQKNSLMGSNSPGIFLGPRSVVIRHREYLGEVSGSTGFVQDNFIINPGNSKTFPWLSQIAGNFQQYKFKGLVFQYKSTSADALNSTNTALGSVMLATKYNSQEEDFISKLELSAHEFSSSGPPSRDALHPIECDMRNNPIDILYVDRSNGNSEHDQSLLYDLGKFYLCSDGMQAVSNIGELWVSYEVELLKPRLAPLGARLMERELFSVSNSVTWTAATAFTAPVHVGSERIAGLSIAAGSITFPPMEDRTFLIVMHIGSTVAAVNTSSNWTITNSTQDANLRFFCPVGGVTASSYVQYCVVSSDSDPTTGMVLSFAGGDAHGTGVWNGRVLISELPDNYLQ